MKRRAILHSARGAFTLVELMASGGAGVLLIGILASASIAIQKSILATNKCVTGLNNQNRLVDYVAQDLRRAVRVGKITSGTYATARNFSSYAITDTNVLAVNIPDYYGSNTPDNATGSAFKTARYRRNGLDTLAT